MTRNLRLLWSEDKCVERMKRKSDAPRQRTNRVRPEREKEEFLDRIMISPEDVPSFMSRTDIQVSVIEPPYSPQGNIGVAITCMEGKVRGEMNYPELMVPHDISLGNWRYLRDNGMFALLHAQRIEDGLFASYITYYGLPVRRAEQKTPGGI